MKKFRLLLLDANIVIEIFRELWTTKGFQEKLYGIGRKNKPPK